MMEFKPQKKNIDSSVGLLQSETILSRLPVLQARGRGGLGTAWCH